MKSGLWVLSGVLIFTIVEKIFSGYTNANENNPQPKCVEIVCCLRGASTDDLPEGFKTCTPKPLLDIEDVPNGCLLVENNKNKTTKEKSNKSKDAPKKVAGYLNLIANSIDNFTHGLGVAGAFLVSFRHGVLATFAILCKHYLKKNIRLFHLIHLFLVVHEIPHEVGDFAILLRSGFSRWDAAKAQLLTAGAGLLGALGNKVLDF
jgi:zinc transporter 13